MQYYKLKVIVGWGVLAILPFVVVQAGVRFDGDNSITLEKPLARGIEEITIMMWVKGRYIKGNLVTGPLVLQFLKDNGFYLGYLKAKGSGYLAWDKDITISGKWRHLSASWGKSDGKMKLYVDGIRQEHDRFGRTNVALAGGVLRFCGKFNAGIGAFKGDLEDVRVYSRALTDEEVLQVYRGEGGDNVTSGMMLRFLLKDKGAELKMERNSITILDKSGNGNDGKMTSAPVWINNCDADQRRRKQIRSTCEYLGRVRAKVEKQQQNLVKWFQEHPETDKKKRARFEELNQGFNWSPDVLRGYNNLTAEIGLVELFSSQNSNKRGLQIKTIK